MVSNKLVFTALLAIAVAGQQMDYNTQVKNKPILSDAGASTFAIACARGASGAVVSITTAWLNVPTQSCSANLAFNGGSIQPASGAVVTLTGVLTAAPFKIFDYSSGGTVILAKSLEVLPEWFGVLGDNSTNNTTTLGYVAAAATNIRFQTGTDTAPVIYRFVTSPTWKEGTWLHGGGRMSTILRPVGSTTGITFGNNTTTTYGYAISDLAILPDGGSTYGLVFRNAYNAEVRNVFISDYQGWAVGAVTPVAGGSCITAGELISSTGAANSANINHYSFQAFDCAGDAVQLTADGANGGSGINYFGGHLNGSGGFGLHTFGGSGAHEIHIYGTLIEGNASGEIMSDWLRDFIFDGIHVEHVNGNSIVGTNGTAVTRVSGMLFSTYWKYVTINGVGYRVSAATTTTLTLGSTAGVQNNVALGSIPVVLGSSGVPIGGSISRNNFSCSNASTCIYFGQTGAQSTQISGNSFAQAAVEAMTFDVGGKLDILITGSTITSVPRIYNYDSDYTNFTNLCVFERTLFNGCLSTTSDGRPQVVGGATNYIASETGTNNNIAGTLTYLSQLQGPGFNPFTDGFCVTVKLAHTLQAGANTFNLNPVVSAGSRAIKSHINPANDIGTAYAATGRWTGCWDSTAVAWLDQSQ